MGPKECHERESVRGGLKAFNSQEPESLLSWSEVQRQDNFPGHGNACGYSTRRAERKDTIRTGAFAVLVWETLKASEHKLLEHSTLWSPFPHSQPRPRSRAQSALRSPETSRNGTHGEDGQGAGVIGEFLTAVRTLKSSRLRYRNLATFTFPMAAPGPAPKPLPRPPGSARRVGTPPLAHAHAPRLPSGPC